MIPIRFDGHHNMQSPDYRITTLVVVDSGGVNIHADSFTHEELLEIFEDITESLEDEVYGTNE